MRSLSTPLIQSLMEEEPFRYAHLVKFEKPIKTESGKPTKKATSYSYITDASIDIDYDDGSLDVRGTANGSQTYIANRLLDVSGISETIEARASNFSITIGASALNTSLSATFTIAGTGPYTITSNQNLVEAGFLEGDEIYISGGSSNWTARIDRFITASGIPNATAYLTLIEGTSSTSATNILLNTKDIGAILLPKTNSTYARYINREIFVYKAHISVNTGAIIGTPFLLFKGIITSGSLTEDVIDGSKMTWNISSHWGDWVRVNGRVTSDSHHRALNSQGFSDREALVRPEYADDLGFLHSEQALNIMAVYKVKETRYKMKKSGLFGMKVKMKEYQVLVDREVDLRFNLEAKYLPVVYGVQRVDTIPFFVDTDKTNPNKVYVAYALCEGEIAGIYDIYFGDQSSICIDANDYDTRASPAGGNGNIDVLCSGRADRGDVLKEQTVNTTNFTYADVFGFNLANAGFYAAAMDRRIFGIDGNFSGAVQASPTSYGIVHEKGRSFTDPIDCKFIVHTGKRNQAADSLLSGKAQTSPTVFKVQGDYYTGDKSQYWGPNHRVLDTAYVVAEFTLSEGEEELPEVEFVVKGKLLECYNYDYSYIHDPASTYSAETTASFQIGDIVTLNRTDTNATFNTSAIIADIYTDDLGRTRVRFLNDPVLPTQAFYIAGRTGSPSDPDYHLVTTNYIINQGTVGGVLKQTVSSTSPVTSTKTYSITIGAGTDVGNTVNLTDPRFAIGNISPTINITSLSDEAAYKLRIIYGSSSAKGTGSTTTDIKGISSSTSETTYTTIISKNGIKLAAGASATNDFYNGYVLELTRTNTDGSTIVQTRNIIDYDGTNKLAIVDEDWDPVYFPTNEPTTPDTYKIYAPDDTRVSNNPAIQLLDYITSERYGRGLSVDNDINLETFKQAARKCDTRSDITVVLSSGTATVGEIYEHKVAVGSTFVRIFKGTVSSVVTAANGPVEVTFTDVIGKLGKKWFDWKSYTAGDLIWNAGKVYRVTTSGTIGVGSLIPANELSSVTLTRLDNSNTLTLNITSASFDGNPLVKQYIGFTNSYISGYSLYDCDDVKYWRYVGWNAQDQNYVTRHQTNIIVNTSNSVFDNINMLLGHFNGILRYNAGKYELDVEARHVSTEAAYGYNEVSTDLTAYSPTNITTGAGITGPAEGNSTSIKLIEVATSPTSTVKILRTPLFPSVSDYETIVASAYFKAAEYTAAGMRIQLKDATNASASFDLTGTGAYKIITPANTLAAGIYSVGNGWYRCWLAGNVRTGGTAVRVDLGIDNTYADNVISYSSSGSINGIYASTPKVEFYRSLDYNKGPTSYLYYPNIIAEDDIIGAISIEDPGNKETYNTISVDIPDPRNRFEERSVTYFNSTYLVEDNNVPKKGDMKATGITNYFNARMNAKQYLEQSRYGLKISFTMPPKGLLITAGSIIEITNSRLGFSSKPFRVTNITINKDCLVQINADEHTNNAYLIGPSSSGAFSSSEPSTSITGGPDAITGLTASNNQNGSIILNWTNPGTFNSSTDAVEIYRNSTSSFSGASKIAVVSYATTFTDVLAVSSSTNYWYWVRVLRESYKKATNSSTALYSVYYPLSSSAGVQGTALSSLAVSYSIVVSAPVIFKDAPDAATSGVHSVITVSPTRTIGTVTSPFGFVTFTANGDTETASGSPYIISNIANNAGKSIYTVRMYDTSPKTTLLDSQDIPVVFKGASGTNGTNPITAVYTNEAHVVPVTTNGTETWTNSGGLFYVYEGISPLVLNSNTQSTNYPSVSSPSQYNLNIALVSGNTLTSPNITGAGTTTANISPWAGDLTGVTVYRFTAYIRTASGNTLTRQVDATIAPSNQGATGADSTIFWISASSGALSKNDNNTFTPVSVTYSAFSRTGTGAATPYNGNWLIYENGVQVATPTGTTYTQTPTTAATSLKAELYVSGGTTTKLDETGVAILNSASNAISVILSNESHVFPADNTGAVTSYSNSGTDIRVYEGATELIYSPSATKNSRWTVSGSPINITIPAPVDNGTYATYTYTTGVATGTDTSSASFTVTGKTSTGASFTSTKVQKFSKSKTGAGGAAGANAVVAVLSKDSHVFPASPDGTVTNYTGATTDIRVYEGATELVYSPAATKNGRWTVSASPINITAPAAVDNGTYATYTYTAGVAPGTDTSSSSYTITGKTTGGTSFTLTKVQSFSKSKIGNAGTDGVSGSPAVYLTISRPSASIISYADGTVKSTELPIGGVLTLYKGTTNVTASAGLSATPNPVGGLAGYISPTNGNYAITSVSPTIDSGTLNLSAVYEGVTYTAAFSISKSKIGYEIVANTSAVTGPLFAGRMVFATDDNKLYRYTGSAWTKAVDGGDISPGTLAATAFATNIKPVEIVTSPLPTTGLVEGRVVYLTDDKKLYRYSGTAWTRATDGADITANSITAGQIQAGAIGATQIAAGAITTNKLAVSSSGFNLTRDPAFSDSTAWYKIEGQGTVTFESSPSLAPPFGTTFAKVVNSAGTSPDSGAAFTMGQSGGGNDRPFPVTTGRRYKVSVWIRTTSTLARHYVRVYWYDANTTLNTTSATLTAISPNITASENFTLTAANTWQRFTWYWDAPANAVSALPRVWGCWNASPNTSYFNDFRVEEFIGGELVVDGTIKGTKIEADSITANQIAGGTITAAEIATSTITADKLTSSSITSRELAISLSSPGVTPLTGIYMDSAIATGPKIDIYDTGVLRVRIGRLT